MRPGTLSLVLAPGSKPGEDVEHLAGHELHGLLSPWTLKGNRHGQRKNWLTKIKDWTCRPVQDLLLPKITRSSGPCKLSCLSMCFPVYPSAGQGATICDDLL